MQNFMSCIRYNKSLTITNIQLIITKIRFSMCRTSNVWSNMLIRTCIGEPSDRIWCWSITKREVGQGLIPMMNKLRALLCRVSDVAAKLASNLLRPLVLPFLFLLLPIVVVVPGVLPGRAPIVSTIRLTMILFVISVRVTSPASSSSFAPMRRGVIAIKSNEGMMCSICKGRVWRCRQQRCGSWNRLKRASDAIQPSKDPLKVPSSY